MAKKINWQAGIVVLLVIGMIRLIVALVKSPSVQRLAKNAYLRTWIVLIAGLGVIRLVTMNGTSSSGSAIESGKSDTTIVQRVGVPGLQLVSPAPAVNPGRTGGSDRVVKQASATIPSVKKTPPASQSSVMSKPSDNRGNLAPGIVIAETSPRNVAPAGSPTTQTSNTSSYTGYFTVGSTREEVLALQGTPTEFTNTSWTYGFSKVYFRDGRVTSWDNTTINPLRVRMLPTSPVSNSSGYFTIGSTKDEVLSV